MRYGLIAGNGKFPFRVVEGARRAGVSLAVAAIHEETAPELEHVSERFTWVGIGQLGKMIRFFKAEDVDYGLELAHEIARLDLGQTIVVRAKACVAIEAMEGTDATIRRAGELIQGNSKSTAGAVETTPDTSGPESSGPKR